jgi:Uma2 family endonuclease
MEKGFLHRPETAVDVFKLLPEGVLCQVIDNAIYISPAPSFEHQVTISNIHFEIMSLIKKNKLGVCVSSPVDVYLDKYNAYQPDILYISNENLSIIGKDGRVHGAPDLVVEVLSPSNAEDDKKKKKIVYEKCGVREYFIVDPAKKDVTSYYLKAKKFEKGVAQKGKIISRLLRKTFKF